MVRVVLAVGLRVASQAVVSRRARHLYTPPPGCSADGLRRTGFPRPTEPTEGIARRTATPSRPIPWCHKDSYPATPGAGPCGRGAFPWSFGTLTGFSDEPVGPALIPRSILASNARRRFPARPIPRPLRCGFGPTGRLSPPPPIGPVSRTSAWVFVVAGLAARRPPDCFVSYPAPFRRLVGPFSGSRPPRCIREIGRAHV